MENMTKMELPKLHGRLKLKEPKERVETDSRGEPLQEMPTAPFVESFSDNLARVVLRMARLIDLCHTGGRQLDKETYADAILAQIAAMCVENDCHDENYTIQVFLKRQKKEPLAVPITTILEHVMCQDCDGTPMTVRQCLRILRNKFICHYDNFEDYDIYGNEGVGDGKWLPSDKEMLIRLLFPMPIGPIQRLISAMLTAFCLAKEQGENNALHEFFAEASSRLGIPDCADEVFQHVVHNKPMKHDASVEVTN